MDCKFIFPGILARDDERSDDEDIEIEILDEEAPFLQGCGRQLGLDMSPIKIVKVRTRVLLQKQKWLSFYWKLRL